MLTPEEWKELEEIDRILKVRHIYQLFGTLTLTIRIYFFIDLRRCDKDNVACHPPYTRSLATTFLWNAEIIVPIH